LFDMLTGKSFCSGTQMRLNILLPKTVFVILSAVVVFCTFAGAAAQDNQLTFIPGERLLFKLSWGFIPAGQAVLEVLPIETVNGVKTYHFIMQARTNSFIDKIYKYRARIDAYADVNMTRSVMYRKETVTGRSAKKVQVLFDWEKNEALYHHVHTRPGQTPEISKQDKRTALLPGTFDPLSVFYYTRLLTAGKSFSLAHPVTDGKDCVVATADIVERVKIRVNGTNYDTFLVQPDLKHLDGVFHKKKDAKISIWVTADKRRIPVKIKSRVYVGSFTGELVAIEGPEDLVLNSPRAAEKGVASPDGS